MNESNNNANETGNAKKQWKPGGLFVVTGIVFCTLGGTNIISGIIQQKEAVADKSYTGKIVAGGMMLAAGIINVGVGLAKKKRARTEESN